MLEDHQLAASQSAKPVVTQIVPLWKRLEIVPERFNTHWRCLITESTLREIPLTHQPLFERRAAGLAVTGQDRNLLIGHALRMLRGSNQDGASAASQFTVG